MFQSPTSEKFPLKDLAAQAVEIYHKGQAESPGAAVVEVCRDRAMGPEKISRVCAEVNKTLLEERKQEGYAKHSGRLWALRETTAKPEEVCEALGCPLPVSAFVQHHPEGAKGAGPAKHSSPRSRVEALGREVSLEDRLAAVRAQVERPFIPARIKASSPSERPSWAPEIRQAPVHPHQDYLEARAARLRWENGLDKLSGQLDAATEAYEVGRARLYQALQDMRRAQASLSNEVRAARTKLSFWETLEVLRHACPSPDALVPVVARAAQVFDVPLENLRHPKQRAKLSQGQVRTGFHHPTDGTPVLAQHHPLVACAKDYGQAYEHLAQVNRTVEQLGAQAARMREAFQKISKPLEAQ